MEPFDTSDGLLRDSTKSRTMVKVGTEVNTSNRGLRWRSARCSAAAEGTVVSNDPLGESTDQKISLEKLASYSNITFADVFIHDYNAFMFNGIRERYQQTQSSFC